MNYTGVLHLPWLELYYLSPNCDAETHELHRIYSPVLKEIILFLMLHNAIPFQTKMLRGEYEPVQHEIK